MRDIQDASHEERAEQEDMCQKKTGIKVHTKCPALCPPSKPQHPDHTYQNTEILNRTDTTNMD